MKGSGTLRERWHRLADVQPEYLFLLFTIPFALVFVLMLPPGAGMDEANHISRTDQLAAGQLTAYPVGVAEGLTGDSAVLYGGSVDKGLYEATEECGNTFRNASRYSFPPWSSQNMGTEERLGQGSVEVVFSNTAVYSPLVYAPYVVGFWVANLFSLNVYSAVVLMRLCGLLVYLATFFLAIRFIPFGKWAILFIGLIPQVLIGSCCVSADNMSNCAALFFIVCFMLLVCGDAQPSRRRWAVLLASCVALALVKMTYFPLTLLLFFAPIWNKSLRHRRQMFIIGGIFIASACVFLSWYLLIRTINTGAMWVSFLGRTIDPESQKAAILERPLRFLYVLGTSILNQGYFSFGMFGSIDYRRDYNSSGTFSVLLLVLVLVYFDRREHPGRGLSRRSGTFLLASYGLFLMVTIAIYLALYLQFNAPGSSVIEGVQSRYFIPLLPLLLLPLALLSYRLQFRNGSAAEVDGSKALRTVRPTIFACIVAFLAIQELLAVNALAYALYLY